MHIYSLSDANGVFCDAAAMTEDGILVFASLWGRDTVIQGLLGTLQIGGKSDGLDRIRLAQTDSDHPLGNGWIQMGGRIPDIALYDKLTGRVPKQPGDSVVGTLVNMFLFHKDVRVSTCGYVLTRDVNCNPDDLLWSRFKDMQSLPLLDDWKEPVMSELRDSGIIRPLHCVGCIRGWHIAFNNQEQFDKSITGLIRSGALSIPNHHSQGDRP